MQLLRVAPLLRFSNEIFEPIKNTTYAWLARCRSERVPAQSLRSYPTKDPYTGVDQRHLIHPPKRAKCASKQNPFSSIAMLKSKAQSSLFPPFGSSYVYRRPMQIHSPCSSHVAHGTLMKPHGPNGSSVGQLADSVAYGSDHVDVAALATVVDAESDGAADSKE